MLTLTKKQWSVVSNATKRSRESLGLPSRPTRQDEITNLLMNSYRQTEQDNVLPVEEAKEVYADLLYCATEV